MKRHYKGHRWTNEELAVLKQMWEDDETVPEIANRLNVTMASVLKMVVRLRNSGVPLERRDRGHKHGVVNKRWTQGEIEYLVRRHSLGATSEEIAKDLDRSWVSICAMISKLRMEGVKLDRRGDGRKKLWDASKL